MKRLFASRAALAGGVLVVLVIVLALAAPLIAWHDPSGKDPAHGLSALGEPLGPSAEYPLGTDSLGRCVASRLVYGARTSLAIGLLATLLATSLGAVVGLYAGIRGGWVDTLLMRTVDLFLTFPFLLLVVALAAVFPDAGLTAVLLVLALTSWTGVARVVRAKTLSVHATDYVAAARAVGAGEARLIARHVLPNVLGPIVVMATISVAQMILAESTLSYLGFGVEPPAPSWGRMLADGQSFLSGAPWLVFAPGAALLVTVLGFNLLGDGLRDALDPKEAR